MRWLCTLMVLSFTIDSAMANEAFERLKAKYKALQKGEVTLPTLTQPAPPPIAEQTIRNSDLTGTIPAGEELIMELQLGKLILGQVFGFKTKTGAKLSLGDMNQVFDFAIQTDIDHHTASGWVRKPDNQFELKQLDSKQWQVLSNNQNRLLSPEKIAIEDNFYVDLDVFEQWFDVRFEVDYGTLVLKTTSNSPLPIEEKLAREKRAKNAYRKSNEARAPLLKYDYQPLSKPLLDLQVSADVSQNSDTSHSVSLLGSNDLAYFNTQYFLAFDTNNKIANARLSGSRYSNDNDLLGFLEASTLDFGDIRPTQISPLGSNDIYLGTRVSNSPLSYNGGNSVNLIGDIQSGWDVEVYRNQLLINSQLNITDGQYEFQNVPLVFGYNKIEIVFYGPQGQVNREVQDYYVSSTGQQAGEFFYDMSIIDEGKRLFEQDATNANETNGFSTLFRADYGLTDWWSISLGSQNHLNSTYKAYDQISFASDISLFGEALLSLDALDQKNGDYERRYQLDTNLLDHSVSLIHNESQRTDLNNKVDKFESQKLSISGAATALRLSYEQSFESITTDTTDYLKLSNQIGTSIGNSYLSNRITWSNQDGETTTGDWQIQRYLDTYFLRFGNEYSVLPEFDIKSFFAEISGDMSDDTSGRVRFIYDFDNQISETALVASWQPNEFSLTSNLTYNDRNGWRASLLGRVGIGQTQESTFFTRMPVTSKGTISARVFVDNNQNGLFDSGDQPLPNVEVESRQSHRKATTNNQGIALLSSLPTYKQTDIAINLSTQSVGYFIRADEGVSVLSLIHI